jgi:SAM-dependent methyltransferase
LFFKRFCKQVIGLDVSANQLSHAIPKDNIEYQCHTAEDLSFLQSNSVDLITSATTLHWLDIEVFLEEAKRVLKPHTGVLAVWTYALGTLDNPAADAVYHEFHHVLLFTYWNTKRWLADDYYESLVPLLPYKSTLRQYTIEHRTETTLGHFLGFIESLSACQTYRKQNGEQAYHDMLTTLRHKLIQCYIKTKLRNSNDETIDFDSIKMIISSPIRLYLMKKNQI